MFLNLLQTFNPLFYIINTMIFIILISSFIKINFIKYEINSLILFANFILQLLGLFLWISFDPFPTIINYNPCYSFFFTIFKNEYLGFNLTFGIDGIALVFIELTLFIFTLCFFASNNIKKYTSIFFIILLILELSLILIFASLDVFVFYIFFESSLIPMFFIVGSWGSRSRKIKAVFYLFIYTVSTASLTLIGIFYIIMQTGSTFYADLLYYNFTNYESNFLWLCFFLTFATKIPIMPLHLWLPEAHVEAPTIGSVILASILLKLGGYGCIRFLMPLYPEATVYFLPLTYTFAITSIVFASLITLRQLDIKRIIAYSSIAHMNMVVLGLFAINENALDGAIYLMIGHGVVSSALFFAVGIIYDRFHTRLIKYYNGLIQGLPLFGIFFLLFTLANIGFPSTSNFVGEILIIIGIFYNNIFVAVLCGFGIIFAAIYSFWLYNRIFFTTLQLNYFSIFKDINRKEFLILSPLLFFMFYLGISSYEILTINLMNIKLFFFNFNKISFDFPLDWQCLFQDPATHIMENIIDLHHDIMFFLIVITLLTSYMLSRIIYLYRVNNSKTIRNLYLTHNTLIEIIWTLIPTFILIIIALPSYALIYNIDELNDPRLTIKIIGHQWYWSHECSDFLDRYFCDDENDSKFFFDAYMIKEEDLEIGNLRLLEVDNCLALPVETTIRLLITSSDVIHSWTVPSFGVKMDAVPGRLNQVGILINRETIAYGQCSELCGINHAFMPIGVRTILLSDFIWYISHNPLLD